MLVRSGLLLDTGGHVSHYHFRDESFRTDAHPPPLLLHGTDVPRRDCECCIAMSSGVSLLRAPGPLAGSGLQHRHSFRPAIRSRPVRCQNTTDANADLKVRVKNAVEGAGFRSDVSWEDFLGDR